MNFPPPAGNPQPPTVPPAPPTAAPGKKKVPAWLVAALLGVVVLCCGCGVVQAFSKDDDGSKPAAAEHSATGKPAETKSTEASETTPPAATTAPPTTAPPTTAPAPKAVPKPKVYSGTGDDVISIKPLEELAIVAFKCTACTGNTVLKSDGRESLLVNEIGAYTGKRWINIRDNSVVTQFEIQATSKWTLTIGTVEQLATKAPNGTASGRGDDVVLLGGDYRAAKITHTKGSANFVVYAYNLDTGRGGLLVNEIGGYSGTRPLTVPALVEVTADGKWTIGPSA